MNLRFVLYRNKHSIVSKHEKDVIPIYPAMLSSSGVYRVFCHGDFNVICHLYTYYVKLIWHNAFFCHLSLSSSQWRDTHAEGEEGTRGQWRSRGRAQPRVMADHEKQWRQQKETVPEGACQTMCPARELRDRERQNRLHRFEMLAGTERDRLPRGDPSRAVKEYSRPAAGKDSTNSSDLRPPEVLLNTVCYLIDSIAASPDLHPWSEASHLLILLFCGSSVNICFFSSHIEGFFSFASDL